MTIDWNSALVEQIDYHWRTQLRPRLDGLTDAEYVWEPVEGCWSVRPRGTSTAAVTGGSGSHVIEFAFPPPDETWCSSSRTRVSTANWRGLCGACMAAILSRSCHWSGTVRGVE